MKGSNGLRGIGALSVTQALTKFNSNGGHGDVVQHNFASTESRHIPPRNVRRGMSRDARRTSKYMPHQGKQECARRVNRS